MLVCLVVIALVVLVDQATKAVIRTDLAVGESRPLIDGVLALHHIENTGAAFSLGASTAASRVIFAIVALIVVVVVLLWVWRDELPLSIVFFLAWIAGGGIGNMIDRVAYGSVTDFLATTFIDFPIFNVADIFVTCGVVLAFVSYVLWESHQRNKFEHLSSSSFSMDRGEPAHD